MPTNTSAAAAIVIAELPYSVTTTPSGPTEVLWWTYTPIDCETVISVRPWTPDATYVPKVQFWQGTASSLTAIASGTIYTGTEPTYLPVTPGVPVFVSIADNTTGTAAGTLTLTVQSAPRRVASPGDLVIHDDTEFYPAVVRSRVDGSVVRYLPVTAGEEGTSASGSMLVSDSFSANTYLYNAHGTGVTSSYAIGPANHVTSNRAGTYYVVVSDDLYKIANGTLSTMPYTLPHTSIQGVAVDEAADRLYYTRPPSEGALKYLTLSDGTGATELVPALSGYLISDDVLRLQDGTLVVGYTTGSGNLIKRFSAAGVTLNTIDLGTDDIYHLAHDVHPLKFWVWSYPLNSGEDGRFRLIDAVTGTVETSWDRPTFRFGQQNATGTATSPLFGHSQSCSFWVIPDECEVCDCCDCPVPPKPTASLPGPSGTAEGDDPTRELFFGDYDCAFGGTVPTGTNGTDVENWAD